MSRRKIYSFGILAVIAFSTWIFAASGEEKEEFSEVVKISLREVGNQLLLSNQDSTSLVLPVLELERSKYELSFQNQLSFEPGSLVSIVQSTFQKSALPENYRVEVIQCTDHEVAYSYEITTDEESTIIPCAGRFLPESCYTIEVRFTDRATLSFGGKALLYLPIFVCLLFVGFLFFGDKKRIKPKEHTKEYATIGCFQFYPEQNKLVKEAVEISLSNKESELLSIFVANPNQTIKRDELMKKVWEDHGVIVGRSLDTFISKLRAKLKEDDSVKLTNVHGVGYRLEIGG